MRRLKPSPFRVSLMFTKSRRFSSLSFSWMDTWRTNDAKDGIQVRHATLREPTAGGRNGAIGAGEAVGRPFFRYDLRGGRPGTIHTRVGILHLCPIAEPSHVGASEIGSCGFCQGPRDHPREHRVALRETSAHRTARVRGIG